jgi:hypothetical protein
MRLLWLPDLLGTPLPLRLGFCHNRSLGIERRCVNGVQNTGAARSVDAAAKKPRPIWEKSFGPEHPNIAAGLNNLALLLQTMKPAGGGRAVDAPGAYSADPSSA